MQDGELMRCPLRRFTAPFPCGESRSRYCPGLAAQRHRSWEPSCLNVQWRGFRWFVIDQQIKSVYAMHRASRRSWRIGQTQPVKVLFMAYRNTLHADALKLVAQKLPSSLAVEGELPEDGLAAYGDTATTCCWLCPASWSQVRPTMSRWRTSSSRPSKSRPRRSNCWSRPDGNTRRRRQRRWTRCSCLGAG